MNCTARTKTGRRCHAQALAGADHCIAHSDDPAVIKARAAGRKAGGARRGAQLAAGPPPPFEVPGEESPLLDLHDLETAQRDIAVRMLQGTMPARDALAATRVLKALAERIKDADALRADDDAEFDVEGER